MHANNVQYKGDWGFSCIPVNIVLLRRNLAPIIIIFPRGPVRRLPGTVIELIKTVNRLKLGQLLCRCRSPDFLLDIIRRQVSRPKFTTAELF